MDPQQGQPALQIGDYLATLRLRRWLVLAIAAVFTIGGVLYSLTLKPAYVATSEVLLSAETDPTGVVHARDQSRHRGPGGDVTGGGAQGEGHVRDRSQPDGD